MKNRRTAVGFTLIELLVVITIIAVLAAMLFPVFANVRRSAEKAKCASNMRQIGMALLGYVQENADTFPGPVWCGTQAGYKLGDKSLAGYLAPHLNMPAPDSTTRLSPLFLCPGWVRIKQPSPSNKNPGPVYLRNNRVRLPDGRIIDPCSHPDDANPTPKLHAVVANISASAVFMQDVDELVGGGNIYQRMNWTPDSVPPYPAHGDIRNFLYYDGHVEAVSLRKEALNNP